jgi:tRNA G18 (ribose-2'-O)-methylase SpoU
VTHGFTKGKFNSLKPHQQHKLSARILRELYENPDDGNLKSEYLKYQEWMGAKAPLPLDRAKIAHLYHFHLKEAGVSIKEARFLPRISQRDRSEAEQSLGYCLYLDNLRSAHNVGSILRTVEAFQFGKVVFSPYTPWIDQKKVKEASMGAWEWVECLQAPLERLPRPWIVLETAPEAITLDDYDFPEQGTFILGNEELGCSEELLALADGVIQIPLRGRKNSLNVANAFAILAFASIRQKNRP